MRRIPIPTIVALVVFALRAGGEPTAPGARLLVLPNRLARLEFIPATGVSHCRATVTNWVCLTPILTEQLELLLGAHSAAADEGQVLQVADDATWVDAMLACERASEFARTHGAIATDEVIRIPRVEEYILLAQQKAGELALRNLGVLLDTNSTICREWAYDVMIDAKLEIAPSVRVDPFGESVRILVHTNRCLSGQGSTFRLMISREHDMVVSNKFADLRAKLLLGTANERRLRYGAVLTVFRGGRSAPVLLRQERATVGPSQPPIP